MNKLTKPYVPYNNIAARISRVYSGKESKVFSRRGTGGTGKAGSCVEHKRGSRRPAKKEYHNNSEPKRSPSRRPCSDSDTEHLLSNVLGEKVLYTAAGVPQQRQCCAIPYREQYDRLVGGSCLVHLIMPGYDECSSRVGPADLGRLTSGYRLIQPTNCLRANASS